MRSLRVGYNTTMGVLLGPTQQNKECDSEQNGFKCWVYASYTHAD